METQERLNSLFINISTRMGVRLICHCPRTSLVAFLVRSFSVSADFVSSTAQNVHFSLNSHRHDYMRLCFVSLSVAAAAVLPLLAVAKVAFIPKAFKHTQAIRAAVLSSTSTTTHNLAGVYPSQVHKILKFVRRSRVAVTGSWYVVLCSMVRRKVLFCRVTQKMMIEN